MRIEGSGFGESGAYVHLPMLASPALVPALGNASPPLMGPQVPARALISPTILLFDSGLGGLTVFREAARARPDAHFIYVADDALFPYGAVEESRLIERVLGLMDGFVAAHQPDLVIIACNTASTLVLPALRRRFDLPFVGTVPAIKPACAASLTKRVSVLGTQATVKREYTHALIRQYGAGCRVTLVGSAQLAGFAERQLAGDPIDDAALRAEIAPCFVADGGARTDTVVLACTHYPLLTERFLRLAPWPVRWIDPAPAIARRVVDLVGPPAPDCGANLPQLVFTSGRKPARILALALQNFGFGSSAVDGIGAFDTPVISP